MKGPTWGVIRAAKEAIIAERLRRQSLADPLRKTADLPDLSMGKVYLPRGAVDPPPAFIPFLDLVVPFQI
jgi:hypothetical protein